MSSTTETRAWARTILRRQPGYVRGYLSGDNMRFSTISALGVLVITVGLCGVTTADSSQPEQGTTSQVARTSEGTAARTPLILAAGEGERRIRRVMGGALAIIKVDRRNGGSSALMMGYEEIPPGQAIQAHRHPAMDEIVFVHRGTGAAELGDRTATVGPGATIYIPPATRVTLRNMGSEPLAVAYSSPSRATRSTFAIRQCGRGNCPGSLRSGIGQDPRAAQGAYRFRCAIISPHFNFGMIRLASSNRIRLELLRGTANRHLHLNREVMGAAPHNQFRQEISNVVKVGRVADAADRHPVLLPVTYASDQRPQTGRSATRCRRNRSASRSPRPVFPPAECSPPFWWQPSDFVDHVTREQRTRVDAHRIAGRLSDQMMVARQQRSPQPAARR